MVFKKEDEIPGQARDDSQKTNVLYIITKLELGGAQKICLSLLEYFKQNGNFAGLISGQDGVLVDQVKNLDNIFLLPEFKREVGLKNIFNEFKLFFKLIKIIKENKKKYPNLIVHTHSTKAGILGRWAAFFAGVKNRVHTVHGFGFHQGQNKFAWVITYSLEFFTAIITKKFICVSNFDLNTGGRLLPFFKKRASVINAAVDYEKFYLEKKEFKDFNKNLNQKFIIGTVSCFKPQKNLIDLLKAFKKLLNDLDLEAFFGVNNVESVINKNNIILQIIGDGEQREYLQDFIFKNNLQNNVELLGWQDNVAKFMHNWDLFVLSSLWEGLPCVVVEARLAKLPVIAYKISGIPEVIFDDKNGFLVDSGNWELLSEKIKFVIKDNVYREKLADYNDNLSRFKNNYMISEHLLLYQRIL